MSRKLFIFDLDRTILSLNVSDKQLSSAKERVGQYFEEYGLADVRLRPFLPNIFFLANIATDNTELQKKIIRDCYSIIDDIETNPDGGVVLNQENIALLKELHNTGVKIGILSNNGRRGVINALNITGLSEEFFTFIITRDDVDLPKPFPDPYMKIGNFLSEYDCSIFSDDIYDFLPLIHFEKKYNRPVEKYVVLQMDIRNQSYNWETQMKMDFDIIIGDTK